MQEIIIFTSKMAELGADRSRYAIFRNRRQRPLIWVLTPMNPYDGSREMFPRMCLTPGA